MDTPSNIPDLPELPSLRGLSHLLAACAFIAVGVSLVIAVHGPVHTLIAAVYAASAAGTMAVSAIYHRGRWSPEARRLLRRIDHTMPIIWIAASYTPVLALAKATSVSYVLMTVVWATSMLWIAVRFFIPTPPRFLRIVVPMAFGFPAFMLLPKLLAVLPYWMPATLVFGGVLITLGAIAYYLRWPDPVPHHFGYHEVFHVLVVAGTSMQYAVMYVLMTEGPFNG